MTAREKVAQEIWQRYVVNVGRALPPGLADHLADVAIAAHLAALKADGWVMFQPAEITRIGIIGEQHAQETWADECFAIVQDDGHTLKLFPHGEGRDAQAARAKALVAELKTRIAELGGGAMSEPYIHLNLRDGTKLGCIGRCKVCGKAIQLRRLVVHPPGVRRHELDRWEHLTEADHLAVLNPGVCDAPIPLACDEEDKQ